MNTRSVIIIPPGGSRTPSMRIRISLCVAIFFILGLGFAGYFIPFNSLTIDVVEQNQHRNLTNQNISLLKKIRAIRESMVHVQGHIEAVDRMRDAVTDRIQFDRFQAGQRGRRAQKSPAAHEKDLLARMNRIERDIMSIARAVENNPDFLSVVPISRPLLGQPVVALGFGKARDPFTGTIKNHEGVDLVGLAGSTVVATASGTVSLVDKTSHWGLRVRIQHAYGFSTVYAHLGSVCVTQGQRIRKGDAVGTLGATGMTTGPHLHYEIRRGDTAIDPEMLFYPQRESPLALAQAASGE